MDGRNDAPIHSHHPDSHSKLESKQSNLAHHNKAFHIHDKTPQISLENSTRIPHFNFANGVQACAGINNRTMSLAIIQSKNTKKLYFEALRAESQVTLTLNPLKSTDIKLSSEAVSLLIGDSIVREISEVYGQMLPSNEFVMVENNFESGRGKRATGTMGVSNTFSESKQFILDQLRKNPKTNILFVGGLGIHHLLLNAPCQKSGHPEAHHKHMIMRYMGMFHNISLAFSIPVVFYWSDSS